MSGTSLYSTDKTNASGVTKFFINTKAGLQSLWKQGYITISTTENPLNKINVIQPASIPNLYIPGNLYVGNAIFINQIDILSDIKEIKSTLIYQQSIIDALQNS